MSKKYINESNLQTAMTEYQEDLRIKSKIRTQYGKEVGTVTRVYDNTSGDGEQVYFMLYYKIYYTGEMNYEKEKIEKKSFYCFDFSGYRFIS